MIPLIQLESLSNFKLEQLNNQIKEFREVWVNKKMCSCVNNLSQNNVIDCKHIKKAIKKKFEKKEIEIWNLTLLASLEDLSNPRLRYYFFKNLSLEINKK